MINTFIDGSDLFYGGMPYYILLTDKGNITIEEELCVSVYEKFQPSTLYNLDKNIRIHMSNPNTFQINTSLASININGGDIEIIYQHNIVFSGKLIRNESLVDLITILFNIISKNRCTVKENKGNLWFIDDITNNLYMIGNDELPVIFEIPFTDIENGLLREKGKNGIAIFFNINYKEEYMIIYHHEMDYVSWSLPVNMSGVDAYKMLERFIEKNI